MKKLFKLAVIAGTSMITSNSLAGGGGTEHYLCSSKSSPVSILLDTKLGSDFYKPGFELLVYSGNQTSLYVIDKYSDDGNVISFTLLPEKRSPDFGLITFEDRLRPKAITTIKVEQKGKAPVIA